jgi:lipoprotein-releasing system ATP-binding protein
LSFILYPLSFILYPLSLPLPGIQANQKSRLFVIKAQNIHKSFGQLQVLKGVDMEAGKGEIVSIVGKSGAGKSTLLHILGTLDRADKGQLHINGEDVLQLPPKKLAAFRNQNIGFIFQFHHLLPEFTALENTYIPALIARQPESKAIKRAQELLDYLGLSERLTHKPAQLSGGEQQRVAVARSLMNQPAIVFADEPSGNLDSASSQELHQLIFNLRRDLQQTFIIVTHNQELAAMSDRRLEMQDGRLI